MSATVPPPPLAVPPSPTSTRLRYPDGNNPEVGGIKKALMIVGIAGGFVMYVVPGFFGVRTYRQWKRGEAPTPVGWMTFGVVFWFFFVVVMAFSIATDGFQGL
jgi:hypothetical protein